MIPIKLFVYYRKDCGTEHIEESWERKVAVYGWQKLGNLLNSMKTLGDFGEDTHTYKAQFEGEYNISLSSGIESID